MSDKEMDINDVVPRLRFNSVATGVSVFGEAADMIESHRTRIAELERELTEKDTELEKLREIVEKLPKTADGVTICPGKKIWPLSSNGLSDGLVVGMLVWSDEDRDWWEMCHDQLDNSRDYYSTREAAEQAKGADDE